MIELQEIRDEIERARWSVRGPRRRYSAELVAAAADYARARLAGGDRRAAVSRELGVDVATLDRWLRRPAPGRGRFRVVELAAGGGAASAVSSSLSIRMPSGLRVEGLELRDAIGAALLMDRQLR